MTQIECENVTFIKVKHPRIEKQFVTIIMPNSDVIQNKKGYSSSVRKIVWLHTL